MALQKNTVDNALKRVALIRSDDEQQATIVEFDATVSEQHTGDADITDHPIELGADITDHIRARPEELILNVIVTDTPLIVDGPETFTPAVTGGDPGNRSQEAFELMRRLKNEGAILRVVTRLRDYPSMAIGSVGVIRDKETANIVDMTLGLREINIAITERVDAPEPIPSKNNRKETSNQGKKTKKPVSEEATTATKSKTILDDFLFGP